MPSGREHHAAACSSVAVGRGGVLDGCATDLVGDGVGDPEVAVPAQSRTAFRDLASGRTGSASAAWPLAEAPSATQASSTRGQRRSTGEVSATSTPTPARPPAGLLRRLQPSREQRLCSLGVRRRGLGDLRTTQGSPPAAVAILAGADHGSRLIGSVGGIGGSVLAAIVAGGDYYGFGSVGGIGRSVLATIVAEGITMVCQDGGLHLYWFLVAFVSFVIGLLVYLYDVDPRKTSPGHYGGDENNERSHLVSNGILPPHSIWKDSWMAARSVMKVRTFQIIVLQGIVWLFAMGCCSFLHHVV